jgi:hypothetical protein
MELKLQSCMIQQWVEWDAVAIQRHADEKAGFVCEGRMRACVFKDGKVLDSFIYARVRDNFSSKA